MTKKDFRETLDRVLVKELDETLTPAELTHLSKEIIANIQLDWDPFEEEDPLDVGDASSEREDDDRDDEESEPYFGDQDDE